MKNNTFAIRNTIYRLLAFLLLLVTAWQVPAQIVVDDCNTGAFTQNGPGSQNDIAASGAIGGTRDVRIANTNFGLIILNTATGYLQVRPYNNGSFPAALQGNYDLGWGDNDFLGGNELNLNASSRTQIEVIFTQAPYNYGQMSVRFNKPGDPDYSSVTTNMHGTGTYTFPFSSFAGLNPNDIDGISIGFSNCIPDTTILIGQVQLSGTAPDTDGDGIVDINDSCPGTPVGEAINPPGCSCTQVTVDDGDPCTLDACTNGVVTHTFQDADGDGVCDANDACPATPVGEGANPAGCSCTQVTVDDGDPCTLDACTNGVVTHTIQDADADGVCDANDSCPATPIGEGVNPAGCSCTQVTADDGDPCTLDACTNGVVTHTFQDADSDGVCDANDACPGTSVGQGVDLVGCALPLTLTSFTGQVDGSINVLRWETRTEKDVQSHRVERSADGSQWQEIGRKNGLAHSSVTVQYSLEDRSPLARAYYRLRSVDFDGQESHSNAILLTRTAEMFGISSVFPSPTKDNVTVQFNATQEEPVTARVLDLTGRLLLEQAAEAVPGMNELLLRLTGLPAGVYTVTISHVAGVSAPVRLVKQ